MFNSINIRSSIAESIAIVAAIVGLAVYIFTSTTGYLAGRAVDPVPIVLTVVAVAALGSGVALRERLSMLLRDGITIGSLVLLSWSFASFLLVRVPLGADVYFIPVNYPAAEATALHVSFVGMGLYFLAMVALVIDAYAVRSLPPTRLVVEAGAV